MSSPGSSPEVDLTIDQLAERTGMTVRNVRAYSTRACCHLRGSWEILTSG